MKSKDIEFIFDMFGESLTWKVVKQYGTDWLCCVITEGRYYGTKAEFTKESINFGIQRLKIQSEKSKDKELRLVY